MALLTTPKHMNRVFYRHGGSICQSSHRCARKASYSQSIFLTTRSITWSPCSRFIAAGSWAGGSVKVHKD
eukprot:1269665-Amorphochlora_amoeboformis.AAC.2